MVFFILHPWCPFEASFDPSKQIKYVPWYQKSGQKISVKLKVPRYRLWIHCDFIFNCFEVKLILNFYQVAKGISQGLADNSVVAKVNGEVWDLDRPLENSCSLALIKFDDDEGQAVFWHSSAHILGKAKFIQKIILNIFTNFLTYFRWSHGASLRCTSLLRTAHWRRILLRYVVWWAKS